MIESRKYVPDYYEQSRDYQVFLKLLDLIVNACDGDTKYYTGLLSPMQCKARLLPYLSHYVGYKYDYAEPVKLNRILTKNWSELKRNRGNMIGFRMAIALALCSVEDLEFADIYKMFNVQRVVETDGYGREIVKIRIYLYHYAYLSKLYDLIEAVRPAGTIVEIIPAVPISSSETVILTDEFKLMGYNYATGKLVRIGDIPIYVENCWEIMKNGQSTSKFLVDNEFFDEYHNSLNLAINDKQEIVDTLTGQLTGEVIKAPNIYMKYVSIQKGDETKVIAGSELTSYSQDGWSEVAVDHLEPTGEYFNLEHAARVLNTCYEIRCGGKCIDYYINADNWIISDAAKSRVQFKLKDYIINDRVVKKVYGIEADVKYEWHIDMESGYFIKDGDGQAIDDKADTVPWDEHCYISKKRFVMHTSASGVMYSTEYFVNKHEDIQDLAGNIMLSQKDRYKVSDSAQVGFSEVHNFSKPTSYNKTWIQARSRTYKDDKDYYTTYLEKDYNDYITDSGYVDNRIKIKPEDISISEIVREFDGTNNIGEVSISSGMLDETDGSIMYIPVSCVDGNTRNITNNAYIKINVNLKPGHTLLNLFSLLRFTYDTELVANKKHIIMEWKLAENAEQDYNVFELPEKMVFSEKGTILPRTLEFVKDGIPLVISPKVYDGTTDVAAFEILTDVSIGD